MARRLIGLDIGTNAVTIAEVTAGTPPRLDMFAQVALPRDAMREGEVADEAAVTDAVARLRTEVGLKKVPVRVGIASPRVVVRQVEMPVMTRDELMSALQFQAGDLIPIPIEDAVLDFAILGTTAPAPDSGAEPTMQVLLVAAYEATMAQARVRGRSRWPRGRRGRPHPARADPRAGAPGRGDGARRRRRRRGRRRRRRRGHRVVRRRRHRDRRARERRPAVRARARQRWP